MLKGIQQDNGEPFKREIHSLDEVRESGTYTLIGKNVSSEEGLPPAAYCDCQQCYFETILEVTRNSTLDGMTEKETIGQTLTISNNEDGSTNTYKRSWSRKQNNNEWTPWQMVISGDTTIAAPTNDLNEKISILSNRISDEIDRAESAEAQLAGAIDDVFEGEQALAADVQQLHTECYSEGHKFGISALSVGNLVTYPVGKPFETGQLSNYRRGFFPCVAGRICRITTTGGVNTSRGLAFYNAEKVVIFSSEGGVLVDKEFVAPEGTAYVGVNIDINQSENFSLSVETLFNVAKENANETAELAEAFEALSTECYSEGREFGISALSVGNLVTYPVGKPFETGQLSYYRHGLFPCVAGRICRITTTGGVNTSRGLAFYNAEKVVIFSSEGGVLVDKEFVAPEGTAYVGVNIDINQSENFSLSIETLNGKANANTADIEAVASDVEIIKKQLGVASVPVPLFYGKDMFFVKDTPLDFYAKEVLMKNFPAYGGVYVNNAPIVNAGANFNFALPIINHINPEGKVYFDDNAVVDIYADDGNLYKDRWSVVGGVNVHTTDIEEKKKSVKVLCLGSSTTEIGLATYVKRYLETLGVEMVGCGSKNDYLGTKSEGWYGWSCAQICGKSQNSNDYPQTGTNTNGNNPFMKLATAEDKANHPDYCFAFKAGEKAFRESYSEASDKSQNFYIFDFAWYLQTRQVETPDVVFFLLGLNDSTASYTKYMPWIVDRIVEACPNAFVGINVCQATRLQSDADSKIAETMEKFDALYDYVESRGYEKMKIVSLHAHQSPDFSHNFEYAPGENANTSEAVPVDGFLHMDSNGYLQNAKCIGAFIAYCLPQK